MCSRDGDHWSSGKIDTFSLTRNRVRLSLELFHVSVTVTSRSHELE